MKKVRWGIIGAADIASTFAEGVRLSSNSVLTAVASRTLEKAQAWAARHDVPLAYGSYDAMLESGEIDAVYVPLPNSMHAEWTIRSLRAGLPVLSEKPFTSNAAEAREVLRVRDETGLPVAEGFMYRFHPMYDELMARLEAGVIGEIVSMQSTFTFMLDDPGHIACSAEMAGGSLMDVGCYPVTFARRIMGCEPLRATAFMRGFDVDFTFMGLLEFPNGVIAGVESSIECFERVRAEIVGTLGSIVLDSPFNPGDEHAEFTINLEGSQEVVTTPGANRFMLEVEDFAKAVLHGTPVRWPVEDAIGNMTTIDALIKAARTRTVVDVESL